jgi:hypothetical protein
MTGEEHLSSDLLLRFLLGKAADGEKELVVRHLLRGCEPCRKLAWQAWFPGEEVNDSMDQSTCSMRGDSLGEADPEQLVVELTPIISDLSEIQRQLERLEYALPESNARADIQCCIVDRLSPLIENLTALRDSANKNHL